MSVPTETFKNVWPFKKSRVELTLQHTYNKDIIATGHVYAALIGKKT